MSRPEWPRYYVRFPIRLLPLKALWWFDRTIFPVLGSTGLSLSLSLSLCQVVVERAVVRSSWELDSEKLGEMETGEELLATESVTHPQVSNIRIHRGSRVSLSCIMRIDNPFPCFTLVCERCGC